MKSIRWMMLAVGVMPVIGCGATADDATPKGGEAVSQEDQPLEPIATIHVDSDTTVSFFEPQPGVVVAMEKGKSGNTPVMKRLTGLDATAIYEKISGAKAPEILRRAVELGRSIAVTPRTAEQMEARARLHRDESAAATMSTQDGLAAAAPSLAADDTWFWNTYCTPPSTSIKSRWRNHVGNDTHQFNDILGANVNWFSISGAFKGTIKWRTWFTWSNGVVGEITEGQYIDYYHSESNGLDFDIKVAYSNATNDVYDSCIYGRAQFP
jgi:hypothetical protein